MVSDWSDLVLLPGESHAGAALSYGFTSFASVVLAVVVLSYQKEEDEFVGENDACPQDVHIRVCPLYLCF